MNKKEFLKELESRISILEDSEVKDIIEEYSNHIEQKIKDGKSEEEAIKDFGDMNDLTKEILSAYKIKDNYKNGDSNFEKNINTFIDKLVIFFQELSKKLNKMSSNEILELIIKVVFAVMILSVLQIPVHILTSMIGSIFKGMPGVGVALYVTWNIIAGIITFTLSVFILYYIFKRLMAKNFGLKFEQEINEEIIKENKSSGVKIEKEAYKRDKNIEERSGLYIAFSIIIKFFAVITMIPIIASVVGFSVAFAVMIALAIKGIIMIDVMLILLGLIFIFGGISGTIHYLAFKVVK